MALTLRIVAMVEAKPGKEAEVEAFVKAGQGIVEQDRAPASGTASRSMTRPLGSSTPSRTGRAAGAPERAVPGRARRAGPQLLAKDPDIRLVDVLAVKGA